MASIERRARGGRLRWYARYRDPAGRQRTKTFDRKVDAERFLASVETDKMRGTYLDPARGRVTVAELAERWLRGKINLKPSTISRYELALSVHVLPRWGTTPLIRIEHGEVQAWLAELSASGQSAASVRKIYGVLSSVLSLAVRDRRIPFNPAEGVSLPRIVERRRRYLTARQVGELAAAAGEAPHEYVAKIYDQYRLAVLVLAYCGLRWSELAALKRSSVDLRRSRLQIREAVVELNGGRLVWGTPKSHESRSVPLPRFLADELAELIAGKAADELIFLTPFGHPLRNRNARRDWFDRAAAAIGEPTLTPHALRHTAASLAVSAGANVKAVQRMLGHASAAMTLDRYADLFDDDLDAVAKRLDAVARSSGCVPDVYREAAAGDGNEAGNDEGPGNRGL